MNHPKDHHVFISLCGLKFMVFLVWSISLVFCYCTPEPKLWELTSQQQGIGDYMENHPGQFSEFSKLADMTKLKSLLNVRGPYTVFLPTNEAMLAYYKEKKVTSLNDFTESERQKLIRNHIFITEIHSSDIGFGALRDTNALGDYMETEFKDADTYLNRNAKIIQRNIEVNNGYIHVIDNVLEPVTKDVFTLLSENASYKIFTEGLRLTGIKDTLQLISVPLTKRGLRTRYTLLAVPDTIYHRFGIYNVQDLINWCGANPDSLTSKNNPFYRYIEYHCLNNTYFLNGFWNNNYTVLSGENNINMVITDDYKINLDTITQKYTGFIIPASNVSAKNGVIHTVNGLLPIFYPKPTEIYFYTTDYPDLKQGDYYMNYYMKWIDGQNTFSKIKFEGELQYYYNIHHTRGIFSNNDCLSMSGIWWIELTTPKITKGPYHIYSYILSGDLDFARFDVYIDGIKIREVNATAYWDGNIGNVNWTRSGEHKIRLVCTMAGRLFWDYVKFTPILKPENTDQ